MTNSQRPLNMPPGFEWKEQSKSIWANWDNPALEHNVIEAIFLDKNQKVKRYKNFYIRKWLTDDGKTLLFLDVEAPNWLKNAGQQQQQQSKQQQQPQQQQPQQQQPQQQQTTTSQEGYLVRLINQQTTQIEQLEQERDSLNYRVKELEEANRKLQEVHTAKEEFERARAQWFEDTKDDEEKEKIKKEQELARQEHEYDQAKEGGTIIE